MKGKKLLSVLLSLCMVLSVFAGMTFTASVTVAADGSATATTTAIHIGPSERYGANVPSGIFLPLVRTGTYSDGTIAHITAKIKMISGTKPYVQMARSVSATAGNAGSISIYQASGISSNWNGNDASSVSNGVFDCYVKFKDIPNANNCFYGDTWNGNTQTRRSDIPGRSQPIWGGIYIGNGVINDNGSMHGDSNLALDFIITDISVKISTLSGGSGGHVGDELAPATTLLDEGKVYTMTAGAVTTGGSPNDKKIKNHVLQATPGIWSAVTADEDTVRQVTVADDTFSGGSHTYTKHNETDTEIEYYTCSDFGSTKFEKIGNCYSVLKNNDSAKKAFVIKSHPGEAHTGNSGKNAAYSNIFIPLNVHKYFSAYNNADSCYSATNLVVKSGNFKLKVTCKARRISGSGQPIVGKMYAYSTATSTETEPQQGAPIPSTGRAYNNNCGAPTESSRQQDYITSTYNASTGDFEAIIRIESQEYGQMSKTGISTYITIGQAEHSASAFDAIAADSSFVISDIKFQVYSIGDDSSTVLFSGANQAPKMSAANCDADSIYKYINATSSTDTNGSIDVAMRHAPLNKFSVEGAVQNVSLIDSNTCNHSACTLTKHAATDTTREYYSCATHSKNYDDKFATNEINSTAATKKMVVVNSGSGRTLGAFITLDTDRFVGDKTFIFKCRMKLISGNEIPTIQEYRASAMCGGTVAVPDKTSSDAKNGVRTLWTDYDAENQVYTAAIVISKADPKDNNQVGYYQTTTGAHTALMIGNFKSVAGQTPSTTGVMSSTSFAFTDPELYAARDAATGTTTGPNFIANISDKTSDFTSAYKYSNCTLLAEEYADRASDTIMAAPLNTWSRYGDGSYIYTQNVPENYFVQLASDIGTEKMFTISPTSSGASNIANVIIPVNFRYAGDTYFSGSYYYFKLTFKAKLANNYMPIVGITRYAYWNGGSQSEYNYANNNQKSHDDTVLKSGYDPYTLTYSAIIKMYIADANCHSTTGVHSIITIGNAEHNDSSYDENNFGADFSFTSPELYAYNTTTGECYGENLIPGIYDDTTEIDTTYNFTSNGYTGADGFMSAPENTWCIDGKSSLVSLDTIPAGYFNTAEYASGEPKMLRLAGANNSTNQQALALEKHLDASATYQFDLDYRAFGGVDAYILMQTRASGGSYSSNLVTFTATADDEDGAHRSVRFTMPASPHASGNFKVYIGQKYPLKNSGVVYFSDAKLRKVTGGSLGENLLTNGDFSAGSVGQVNTFNISEVLEGWTAVDILNYPSATLLPVPEDFFSGNAVAGDNTIALTMNGGNYTELQFKTELKPSTYYKLLFNYRNIGKMPRLDITANGTVTSTKLNTVYSGKNCMVYELYSDENNTSYSGTDANTRIRLKFGASSSNKTLYIADVELYELSGHNGTRTGTNLVGNLNATLDPSLYGDLDTVLDTVSVRLTQDGGTNASRDAANGWFGSSVDNSSYANAALVKVPGNFFNYYSYADRLTMMTNVLLGRASSDGINPYYNPNNDSTWCDIIDLVHCKKQAAGLYDEVPGTITINGNDVSQYRFVNNGAKSSAYSMVTGAIGDYIDADLQSTNSIPADGKAIVVESDATLKPNECKVYLDTNTLHIAAHREEFTPQVADRFESLLTGTSVNFASGYQRTFNVDSVAYGSAAGTKRLISSTNKDAVSYTAGQTATIRIAAVDLANAKILTGVPYLKVHTYNESTGATTDQYVTQTNGVYEFTATSSSAGFVFWYAIACDSSKNKISSFTTVDTVSGTDYHAAGSVGFNVSSINTVTAKPSDFNTYWQGVASNIGSTSGAITSSVSANSGYNCELVKIPCGTDINGNQGYATGYLTYPSNASTSNKIKLRVDFQSYSVSVPSKIYAANTAVFTVCAHSMDITDDSSISAYNSYKNSNGFNYTASTIEGTYFYQMIRRDLTAAKYLIDRFGSSGNNFWNGTDFEASGASMGGFQSTAVAALLKYATANGEGISHLNIKIPYMCDMNGENNGRMPRYWGARYTNTLKYFDTTYFGSMVTCKTSIFAGLGDSICPASGTTSLYNAISASDKTITYSQGTTHNYTSTDTQFVRSSN